jgi:hypothetical protein
LASNDDATRMLESPSVSRATPTGQDTDKCPRSEIFPTAEQPFSLAACALAGKYARFPQRVEIPAGTVLAPVAPMQRPTSIAATAAPSCLVRWVLRQGPAALTCQVGMTPDRSFEIAVIPSSRSALPIRERFSGALAAMERHAEIAGSLRAAGWVVSRRSTPAIGAAA